jgi:YidC/Oxa1 family membrane protein insertase
VSILNPLFDAVAWVIMRIHAWLSVPFGASSGWAWGLTIVLLVMLMRALMVPLFVKQVKSQRKMQAHMPQLQELRKRYKNDKQRLNEETMKFYKENGINPLGGCLPLIAQLPLFWALFYNLRAISEWQPGQKPKYGLTVPVVESALHAHIFGVSLADKFLFPIHGETWSQRIVILVFVAISASTTYLTVRQSSKRGMMQQGPVDPDNPAANMQKYMMYIAPFFALTGLYWQFGLVIYWVTTNVWTLGQQHILFRNLPVVGSATVGASAVQPASASALTGSSRKAVTGSSGKAVTGSSAKAVTSGKSSGAAKSGGTVKAAVPGKSAEPKDSVPKVGATRTAASRASATRAAAPKTAADKPAAAEDGAPKDDAQKNGAAKPAAAKASAPRTGTPKASANGSAASGPPSAAQAGGGARGLLRFGKPKSEPEAVPAAPQTKTVRQQPSRQTRSKRSGKR